MYWRLTESLESCEMEKAIGRHMHCESVKRMAANEEAHHAAQQRGPEKVACLVVEASNCDAHKRLEAIGRRGARCVCKVVQELIVCEHTKLGFLAGEVAQFREAPLPP